MASATAVVQIVGLVVLSFQILPGGGLGAVAPRIPCSSSGPMNEQAGPPHQQIVADLSASAVMKATGVEEHEALLIFPVEQYRTDNGWAPALFESNAGYYYVKLDGERIRFLTPASGTEKKRAPSPKRMAESVVPFSADDLGLPHIEEGQCCVHPALRPEYTWPDYSLAAAVVDFSNGSAFACMQEKTERKDTIVNIPNDGTLIVEATKGNRVKSITLNGAARITFANIPPWVRTGGEHTCAPKSMMHNMAYGAMLRSCATRGPCPSRRPDVANCKKATPVGRLAQNLPPPIPDKLMDASCSNSQWP